MDIKIHLSADDNIIAALVDGVMAWAKASEYQYKTEKLKDRRERDKAGHLAEWSIDWASAAPEVEAQQVALAKVQKQEAKEEVKPSSPPQAKVQGEPKAEPVVKQESPKVEVPPEKVHEEVKPAPATVPVKQEKVEEPKVEVVQEEIKTTPTPQPIVQEAKPESTPEKVEQKPIDNVVQMPQRKDVPTEGQVKAVAMALAHANLHKVGRDLLAQMGVQQGISNIPPDMRAEYISRANQALADWEEKKKKKTAGEKNG